MVHVSLALHGLGDVLVQLLNHLEVTEPVLLLEELFLVWELILISLKSMTGKNLKLKNHDIAISLFLLMLTLCWD